MMKYLFSSFSLVFSFVLMAQEKDKALPKGNSEFEAKNYTEAEANYRISLSKNPTKAIASYNLGTSIYKQKQTSEAKYAFLKTIENAKEHSEKHKNFHNLGNVFMTEKDYAAAVEAYKNALRNDPNDEETRYNLALAKKMLKEHPPKDDNKKDKKDKKKEKKKEKKEGQDKDKKEDKGDGDKKKEDDKGQDKKDGKNGNEGKDKKEGNDQEGQPKPTPGGISKQRVENLLEAVNNEEKKIQDKVNLKKVKGKPVPTEKDW